MKNFIQALFMESMKIYFNNATNFCRPSLGFVASSIGHSKVACLQIIVTKSCTIM